MNIDAEDEALFWIARESTGSLRDAYTLFDQVVSFSDGKITPVLIREKLGLVGLERLNELAEACVSGDFSQALALVDGILDAGVAIEQMVIDLAGYYHSLLLIKAGITRESVLGYSPGRFSAKALEKLDEARLTEAQELLFALHRDLRYSLSPRFELETLISKFCVLDRWISPAELRDAVTAARDVLGAGGIARPLAQGAAEAPGPQGSGSDAFQGGSFGGSHDDNAESGLGDLKPGQEGFLVEGFNRYLASRKTKAGPGDADEGQANRAAFQKNATFQGNVTFQRNAGEAGPPPVFTPPAGTESGEAAAPNPQVETVLRLFRGTIVENKTGAVHEHKPL
jgi:DNA polymerase-3 subunit gamma/tau